MNENIKKKKRENFNIEFTSVSSESTKTRVKLLQISESKPPTLSLPTTPTSVTTRSIFTTKRIPSTSTTITAGEDAETLSDRVQLESVGTVGGALGLALAVAAALRQAAANAGTRCGDGTAHTEKTSQEESDTEALKGELHCCQLVEEIMNRRDFIPKSTLYLTK